MEFNDMADLRGGMRQADVPWMHAMSSDSHARSPPLYTPDTRLLIRSTEIPSLWMELRRTRSGTVADVQVGDCRGMHVQVDVPRMHAVASDTHAARLS